MDQHTPPPEDRHPQAHFQQRWYDQDPTLAMAMGLLQQLPKAEQIRLVRRTCQLLEELDPRELKLSQMGDPRTLLFLFPRKKRALVEDCTLWLMEIIKRLPKHLQLEIALNIILLHPESISQKLLKDLMISPARKSILQANLPIIPTL